MSEKIISIFGLIFVTSYVAKYVGPNIFGQIAFATALFQIAMVISQLGSDVIIFKRVSKKNISGIKLIQSTIYLRFIVYVIISIPIIFFSVEFKDDGFIYVVACCLSCLFTSMDVFGIYYDARLESRKNTIVNVVGLIISLLLRWGIALLHLDPIYLSIPIVLMGFIPFIIRWMTFNNEIKAYEPIKTRKIKYMKYLIFAGISFVISTLSVAIYTRISMLSLGYFYNASMIGVFSVAVSLATSWAFICNAFITSTLPSIFSERNDDIAMRKTAKLSVFIFLISMPVIIIIAAVGFYFIRYLYGDAYISAYIPLIVLSLSTMVSSLGVISSRFIARYSGYMFLSKKMFSVAIFSFLINIPLVYFYNVNGAAVSSLLTEVVSLTFFNYFFKRGIVFKMHLSCLFPRRVSK